MGTYLYRLKTGVKNLLPIFLISWYHLFLALAAALFYRFPSRKLKIIAVTGTNGKSSTVEMISQILADAGFKTASLSSIRFRIGKQEWPNDKRMTLPGRFFVQGFLSRAVKEQCRYVVLEITSEGIKQHRHRFINFEAVVFTNLSPEHIENHGSFENYRAAKGQLFRSGQNIHILNLDDENFPYFAGFPASKKYGYGLQINHRPSGDFQIVQGENLEASPFGSSFFVDDVKFDLNLIGKFNVYNALAAIALAKAQQINLQVCQSALKKITGLSGRMEEVITAPFKVFVDYAFTPNALEQAYQALRTNYPSSRLLCVLGAAGGGRDKWKRPILGGLAARFCDEIVLTNEDPYDEDPSQILSEVKSGVTKSGFRSENLYEIIDRREAIRKALKAADSGDTVIITGKGCESSICLAGGRRIPWDDRKVVREELESLEKSPS